MNTRCHYWFDSCGASLWAAVHHVLRDLFTLRTRLCCWCYVPKVIIFLLRWENVAFSF